MASSFPTPKSPRDNAHFYGKRQQMVKVQAMEREIAILEEEIKSLDGVPLASSCCKEIDDFVEATTDPLVEINQDVAARSTCFQKRPRKKLPSKFPWTCCPCCPLAGRTPCCGCCCRSAECNWSCRFKCNSCSKCCSPKLLRSCCSCTISRSSCFSCAKQQLCCGGGKSCGASCFLCHLNSC